MKNWVLVIILFSTACKSTNPSVIYSDNATAETNGVFIRYTETDTYISIQKVDGVSDLAAVCSAQSSNFLSDTPGPFEDFSSPEEKNEICKPVGFDLIGENETISIFKLHEHQAVLNAKFKIILNSGKETPYFYSSLALLSPGIDSDD